MRGLEQGKAMETGIIFLSKIDEIITDLETRISAVESRTRARKEIDQERFVYNALGPVA